MTTADISRKRVIPAAVVAVVALIVAVVAMTAGEQRANADSHRHSADAAAMSTDQSSKKLNLAELAFHDQMRKLWEDHVTWTRLAIVTFADGSPGFETTAARLLQNQRDIGNAIAPFYGTAAGNRLAALLHDHITIAVEVLQAAKAGDTSAFTAANARWYANANDIADFLSRANPRFWPGAVMRTSMKTHLDQTLTEAAHELGGDHAASVADYEAIHRHILDMADLLSSGIIGRFPRKFH